MRTRTRKTLRVMCTHLAADQTRSVPERLGGVDKLALGFGSARWSGMPDTQEAQNMLTTLGEVDNGVGHG